MLKTILAATAAALILGSTALPAKAEKLFNGLSLNGLSLNGLSLNGLSLNGLAINGLAINGFKPIGLSIDHAEPRSTVSIDGIALPE